MWRILVAVTAGLFGVAQAADRKGPEASNGGRVILFEDFSQGMDRWWVEGGERVWIENGRLRVKADPGKSGRGYVATVWCKVPHPADVKIEFDAHVIGSSLDVNNINFFFCYSDPSGRPLFETRQGRASGGYKLYHNLNGYIFTFLKDTRHEAGLRPDGLAKARFRMRRCPGFKLVAQTFDYLCEAGRTYHVTVTKRGGELTYAVDGTVFLKQTDPQPLPGGLLGLRTFRTDLWWDNIKVTALR
ncbi:MAG: DUF1961 family protein [Kiritimatiellaeota bacterium]|nr:DUF1961 family protein [Kiritimatiellota bacterium]